MLRTLMAMLIALPVLAGAPALADAKDVYLAQDNCYAIGQQIAAQRGATLASAEAVSRGGRTGCRIVLIVPGENGKRPRRVEIVVET